MVWTSGYSGKVLNNSAAFRSNYVVFERANAFKIHCVIMVLISIEILDNNVIETHMMNQCRLELFVIPVTTYDG